jgi:hypothetical protein
MRKAILAPCVRALQARKETCKTERAMIALREGFALGNHYQAKEAVFSRCGAKNVLRDFTKRKKEAPNVRCVRPDGAPRANQAWLSAQIAQKGSMPIIRVCLSV